MLCHAIESHLLLLILIVHSEIIHALFRRAFWARAPQSMVFRILSVIDVVGVIGVSILV